MNQAALTRLRLWMKQNNLDRLYVQQPENFSWLTGGDNTIVVGRGVGWLEVEETVRLHTSRVEAARMAEEETPGLEIVSYPWHAPFEPKGETDLTNDLTHLRLVLSEPEQQRYRSLGTTVGIALGNALRAASPEWTEGELAGAVSEELLSRGVQPVVLLVAGERRIFKYRHPLPRLEKLGRLCMGVVCGKRHGLIANVTRLRSFGRTDIRRLNHLILEVESAALSTSAPGASLGEVISAIQNAYRDLGVAEEFENHHQGGLAGYQPREIVATPGNTTRLEAGMALAWNPSLPGAKVEDTFLLTESGLENLTFDPEWPAVAVGGRLRPLVMEG